MAQPVPHDREPVVFCPLPFEAWAVAAGPWPRAGLPRPPIVRTGMGPAAAAAAAASLPTRTGRAVVAGVAGALDPSLALGDVVVADRVLDSSGRPAGADPPAAESLAEALAGEGLPVRLGAVITVGRADSDREERMRLAALGAIAVDMESAPLLAAWRGPMSVVRTISDTTEQNVWSPAIIRGGLVALRSLRRVAPFAVRWAAAQG